MEPDYLSIFYLSRAESVAVAYEKEGEAELRELLSEVAGEMAKGNREPDPKHCPKCPYRTRCEYSVAR